MSSFEVASKRGRTSRKRGAAAEVNVVNWLRQNGWPDARRYLAGDGRQPGDLDWHTLVCCEVKDRADSAWPSWCRQAAHEARPGMVPMVVRRTRGAPDVASWECRVEWKSWTVAAGLDPFALGPVIATQVDGIPWAATTFGAVAAAVKAIDA